MNKFIESRHDILIQCNENNMEMKKINYMLEIDILRNSSQKNLGVLRGAFSGFGCAKRHPDALLAKTMGPTRQVDAKLDLDGQKFHDCCFRQAF